MSSSRARVRTQDDGLVGIPRKLNRYMRAGKKADDNEGVGKGHPETVGEGEVGGGAGLTLIKIRLFKEIKKDEVRFGGTAGRHLFEGWHVRRASLARRLLPVTRY